jgi:L,D-transpeptidase catalytic domain
MGNSVKKLLFIVLIFSLLAFGLLCYKKLLPNCKFCILFQPKVSGLEIEKFEVDRVAFLVKIHAKAQALRAYAAAQNLNTRIVFLVNMGQHSGQKRFYIYDLKNHKIIDSGLVAHGSGHRQFAEQAKFSNDNESWLSSLGKYKVGVKYQGRFGNAYKLHGLESSNSNAFNRNVVLHSYNCVPSFEAYPQSICNSLGCPMVSDNFLNKLSNIIDNENKSIVLWVFV